MDNELNYSIVFDSVYYADNNEDVKQLYGYDKQKLLQHFINNGMAEKRKSSPLFDVDYYSKKYQDLYTAFKKDYKQYYLHYIKHGYQEKRYGCALYELKLTTEYNGKDYSLVYDGLYYATKYPDLYKAYKYDGKKLIYHFVTYGMKEQRIARPTFDINVYKENYPDLVKAFNNDYKQYYLHYINYGFKEKRIADRLINEEQTFIYKSETGNIEIFKEFYQKVNVYAAHLQFTNYSRLKTIYHPSYNTSQIAAATGAVFCVNGSAAKLNGLGEVHDGVIPDFCKNCWVSPALYSQKTGKLFPGLDSQYDMRMSEIVKRGIATDSFGFNHALVRNGKIRPEQGGSRRPRTWVGTNEKPGDIWLVVAEGDGINGNGPGLTSYDCAVFLKDRGCTLVYPLDGGGSSTMWFNGRTINTPSEKGRERGFVGDFVFFK